MKSFIDHLECTYCGKTYPENKPIRLCEACGKVLYARYDASAAKKAVKREAIKDRPASMWRYFEMLPVHNEANVVTLQEGWTPIIPAPKLAKAIGSQSVVIKDEGINPTGTFKVRGISAAISKANELGIKSVTMPTAGNAGGACSFYAARAGMGAYVFMPKDAPEANQKEVVHAGAKLTLVDGLIGEAGKQARKLAADSGFFDLSTLQEPYRAEGKKTMGYEIAEQMRWTFPDVIMYPTGGGTGIVGIWKAVFEMEALGWTDGKRPRIFAVQSENCQPIVNAFKKGAEFAEPWPTPHTIAHGMRVPSAIADYLILRVLRESKGGGVTVSDQEIIEHMRLVARTEGVFVCPEGAATAAGARKLIADGTISPDEKILLLNTGSGLKSLELL